MQSQITNLTDDLHLKIIFVNYDFESNRMFKPKKVYVYKINNNNNNHRSLYNNNKFKQNGKKRS